MIRTGLVMLAEGVTFPRGFRAGATAADIRGKGDGRLDLTLLCSEKPCSAAALFTTSAFKSATVAVSTQNLADGRAQAVIVNSGCANAYVGEQGMRDAREMTRLAAQKLRVAEGDVVVASTGVTGVAMPMENVRAALPSIKLDPAGGPLFAQAIMTTDRVVKQTAISGRASGRKYRIGGCAKGAGMIHPTLATMLAFVTTDAAIEKAFLRKSLQRAANVSLNMVTVDGDTSPSDMLLVLANGAYGGSEISEGSQGAEGFQEALDAVCVALAKALAADAEGATKLIEVEVDGALTIEDARLIARTIAASPLVKAAVYGNDPNWGRVLAAVARSGAAVQEGKTSLWWQAQKVFADGTPVPSDKATLSALTRAPNVLIRVDLGIGKASARAWGCDLTEEYVKINAEYTT